jgi:hypothetical protein
MMYKTANDNVAITKPDRLKPPYALEYHDTCTSSLTLSLPVRLNKDKSVFPHTISDWNQLLQTVTKLWT